MKKYTLEELTDKYVGEKGTTNRDQFDFELKLDILGGMIKKARKEKHLTQEQLGDWSVFKKHRFRKLKPMQKTLDYQRL